MRGYKIRALMFRDARILARSKWRFTEFFYFPVTTVIIWGLFALFSRNFSPEAGLMVLAVNMYWSFTYLAQSTTNMQMNEDQWSGSFHQVMASGFSPFEYLFARILTSTITASGVMAIMLLVSLGFGLTIIVQQPGLVITLAAISLLGSIALSVIVAGLILVLGREYSFLAWTADQIFILLSAPLYPVAILPGFLQAVAMVMPFTFVFEGVRSLVTAGVVAGPVLATALVAVLAYLAGSLPFYAWAFRRAKRNGTLARLF
ncbi:MAG: ABC transporter permease [Candidatus Aenigmarchaeota archaeon]|nr:ABC transporter permease [Candidatus Aenigmarchaeota archaeon]